MPEGSGVLAEIKLLIAPTKISPSRSLNSTQFRLGLGRFAVQVRLGLTVGVISIATLSALRAQSPPRIDRRTIFEICGQTAMVASGSADHTKRSFETNGYDVRVMRNGKVIIAHGGQRIAKLSASGYRECIEELTRHPNARPPGPIDPGKSGPKF